MAVADLIEGPIVNQTHGDAILELAFAVSAVDGHLADEELASFREIVSRVRGKKATDEDVGELLEKFVYDAHTAGLDERVKQITPKIPKELHDTAYALAFGLSLVDKEESEHEDELLAGVAKDLGIDEVRADSIRAKVRKRLAIGA